jgi:hypothetical protein
MLRPRARLQFALPFTLVVTLALALLPAGWRLPWQGDLGRIVHVFLMPFSHAGNALGGWLRPAPSARDALADPEGDLEQLLEQMIEDRDRARAEHHRQRQRVEELEEQLRQLQQIPPETLRTASSSVIAHVAARHPVSVLGVVELKLPRGAAGEIGPNTIAVYAGVHLLGRVVGEPAGATCSLLPIASRDAGSIRGRFFPRDDPLGPGTLTLVEPTGRGTFIADVDRESILHEGDVLRLDDRRWPPTAQGMVLGEVVSVQANDEEPLRETITIQPVYQVQQVASVTLIIERRADAVDSTGEEEQP